MLSAEIASIATSVLMYIYLVISTILPPQRILIKWNRKYCICCCRRKIMDLIFQEIVLSNSVLLTFYATSMKTTTMVILDCEWSSFIMSIPMLEMYSVCTTTYILWFISRTNVVSVKCFKALGYTYKCFLCYTSISACVRVCLSHNHKTL